jgi:diacylglycerol kinase
MKNSFLTSVGCAFVGIKNCFQSETNFKIHFIITFLVVVLAFLLGLSTTEWLCVILVIAMVLTAEMLNTAIEKICNFIHPQYHLKIKMIKDISAGAVLVVAIASAIIGCIIFLPKILVYLSF